MSKSSSVPTPSLSPSLLAHLVCMCWMISAQGCYAPTWAEVSEPGTPPPPNKKDGKKGITLVKELSALMLKSTGPLGGPRRTSALSESPLSGVLNVHLHDLMVAKPRSTSGPPRACQVMQISGPPASWPALREKEPPSRSKSLGSGGNNVASHGQQLGGVGKTEGVFKSPSRLIPAGSTRSRKPTHPARPINPPNHPYSQQLLGSFHSFCMKFFSPLGPISLYIMLWVLPRLALPAILQQYFWFFRGNLIRLDLWPGSGVSRPPTSPHFPSSGYPSC